MAGRSVFIIPIDIVTIKPIAVRTYGAPTVLQVIAVVQKTFREKNLKCFDNISQSINVISQPAIMICVSVLQFPMPAKEVFLGRLFLRSTNCNICFRRVRKVKVLV